MTTKVVRIEVEVEVNTNKIDVTPEEIRRTLDVALRMGITDINNGESHDSVREDIVENLIRFVSKVDTVHDTF